MNIKKYIFVFIMSLGAFNLLYFSECSSDENANHSLYRKLENTEHLNWKEKYSVIKEVQISRITVSESEKAKLIDMFEKESKFQVEYITDLKGKGYAVNDALDQFSKEVGWGNYITYFADFANLISSFRDVRAIPPLLRGLQQYGGIVKPTHIIAMGEKALFPLLDLTDSKDRILRSQAFAVLEKWVNAPISGEDYEITEEMSIKDSTVMKRIKTIFVSGLHDENIDVRSSAVFGLRAFPEDAILRALEEVAGNDTYSFSTKHDLRIEYPIREDAKQSIEKIRQKMKKNMPINK